MGRDLLKNRLSPTNEDQVAPSALKRRAALSPIPVPAPATMIVLPLKRSFIDKLSGAAALPGSLRFPQGGGMTLRRPL